MGSHSDENIYLLGRSEAETVRYVQHVRRRHDDPTFPSPIPNPKSQTPPSQQKTHKNKKEHVQKFPSPISYANARGRELHQAGMSGHDSMIPAKTKQNKTKSIMGPAGDPTLWSPIYFDNSLLPVSRTFGLISQSQ